MDDPTLNGGPDNRVPPRNHSEGHARRARGNSVSVRINATVVKAKAFTKKRR